MIFVVAYLLVVGGFFIAPYPYLVARSVWTDGVNDTCWGNAADRRIDDLIQDCRFDDARNALQRAHGQGHSYEFSEHNLSYRSFGEMPFFRDNDDAMWRRSKLGKINRADDAHKEMVRLQALKESIVAVGSGEAREVVDLDWTAICEADEKNLVSAKMLSTVRVAWFTSRVETLKGSSLSSLDHYFDDMPATESARDTLSTIIVGKLSDSRGLDLEELLTYLVLCNQKARPDVVQKSVLDRIVLEIRAIGERDGKHCDKVFCNLFKKGLIKDQRLMEEVCATILRYNREGLIEMAARNHAKAECCIDEYLLSIDLKDDEIWKLSECASDKIRFAYSRKVKQHDTLVRLAGKYDDVLASLTKQQDLKEVVLMAQNSHVETLTNAISRITNQQMLCELYKTFASNQVDVALYILNEISSDDSNQEFLIEVVKADKDGSISEIAYPKLTKNSRAIVELYKNREGYALHKTDWSAFLKFLYNANSNVVEIVVDSFGSEEAIVSRIAQTATMRNVKLAAISKCRDQDVLRNLASQNLDAMIRDAARERITDRQIVEDICARDDRIRSQIRVASRLANFIEICSNLKYARGCGVYIGKSQMDAVKYSYMPSVGSLGLFRVEVTDCSKSRMFEYPVLCDGSENVFIMRPPCDKIRFKKGDIAYVRGRIKLIDVEHGENMAVIWVEECVTEEEYLYAKSL